MKVICAWCGRAQPDKFPFSDPTVTHAICPECRETESGRLLKPVSELLAANQRATPRPAPPDP